MWMYLGLIAALFYGLHNLCKKHAVNGNEAIPVLLGTISTGFLFFVPWYLLSVFAPSTAQEFNVYIPEISWQYHGFIFIKSAIMTGSWILAYQALKHLPITIVTPIRAAGPFFTLLGALFIYHETPNALQWIGFLVILISMLVYSKVGQIEGINFRKNRWIFAIIGATFLGSSSGLYDKFLVQHLNLSPQTLQFWFCFYVVLLLVIVLAFIWFPYAEKRKKFQFRWSIIGVGILLQAADYFYFKALQSPEAMIMLLSAIKRSQILIAVIAGGIIFKEKNKRKKLVPLMGVLTGVALILYAK